MSEPVDIILLCGGRGTRFWPVTHDMISKALFRLNNTELIKFSINVIDFSYVNNLIFAIDYHAEDLKEWISGQQFPSNVLLSTQSEPGVLEAVRSAAKLVQTNSFIVCNTDEVREGFYMRGLLDTHRQGDSHLVTVATTHSSHLYNHRVINTDQSGRILSSEYHNPRYRDQPNIIKEINAGFALFDTDAIIYFDKAYGKDWSGMLDPLIKRGLAKAYIDPEISFFNVGTMEELENAKMYFRKKVENNV